MSPAPSSALRRAWPLLLALTVGALLLGVAVAGFGLGGRGPGAGAQSLPTVTPVVPLPTVPVGQRTVRAPRDLVLAANELPRGFSSLNALPQDNVAATANYPDLQAQARRFFQWGRTDGYRADYVKEEPAANISVRVHVYATTQGPLEQFRDSKALAQVLFKANFASPEISAADVGAIGDQRELYLARGDGRQLGVTGPGVYYALSVVRGNLLATLYVSGGESDMTLDVVRQLAERLDRRLRGNEP